MRRLMIVAATVSLTACANLPDSPAICVASETARKAHAAALVQDGGPVSLNTGERLLSGLRAACDAATPLTQPNLL